jgi:alpha-1,3-mannosyltransferase
LKLLKPKLDEIGVQYFLSSSDIDTAQDRIRSLAELRNLALKPLVDAGYPSNTTVIFLNDVSICMEDILELAHQRIYQSADMVCAMDWGYVGPDPTFYDVWIARDMSGDTFFKIPEDGNWNFAWNLFWNDAKTRTRFQDGKPFQVFSCWNGAVAFTAKPIVEGKIRFREPYEGECFQGEPKLFCKDMWYHGYGKIAVVPSVNLEYTVDNGKRIKAAKGYVSKWVESGWAAAYARIVWEQDPPALVKCMPTYDQQRFAPWDEGLPDRQSPE